MVALRLALGLGGLAGVFALWVAAVGRWYRLRRPEGTCLTTTCADGGRLAVFHRPAHVRRFLEPVVLCHGIATSHLNVDFEPPWSLAHALSEAGFEVYSVDWRGAGASRPPAGRGRFDATVDDLIRYDGPALLGLALAHAKSPQAFWLGHSMGGLVGYGVAQGPSKDALRGLAALGAPVFFGYQPWLRAGVGLFARVAWPRAFRQRLLSRALAPFLGYVTLPLSDTIVNPRAILPPVQRKAYANIIESVGYPLLAQFRDWVEEDAFRSADGRTDYRAGLARLSLPVLVMGGSQDRLATEPAVRAQFELLTSADKTLMVFGRDNGDTLDYGHGDLLFGAHAPAEIYPRITAWLKARATPVP